MARKDNLSKNNELHLMSIDYYNLAIANRNGEDNNHANDMAIANKTGMKNNCLSERVHCCSSDYENDRMTDFDIATEKSIKEEYFHL